MSPDERAGMHATTPQTAALREKIFDYARERMAFDPVPLDHPQTPEQLWQAAGATVTEHGLGGSAALELFGKVLAPATISTDHPNYLSFIPCAPTEAASMFDLVVSASSIYGGSWMEGAGAVYAENQVLAWLAAEVGLPESAGGVFVQGGTLGNLSALVTAREAARNALKQAGKSLPKRFAIICSAEAHSSLKAAARVMDIDVVLAQPDYQGVLHGLEVQQALDKAEPNSVFAIIATAGTTNFGIVDDLETIGRVANEAGIWFHVDGAYGLAGILSLKTKDLFAGSHRADSFIVDPHKWLFAPFDACALVYRNPNLARAAHAQHGEYLDTLTDSGDWNPSDFAYNLTRRVRGLPLWFSLATHGVAAYRQAITQNIELAHQIAAEIKRRPGLRLIRQPQLSVVVFEKGGWELTQYEAWSAKLLDRGQAFVVASSHNGQPNTRFAIVNPQTKFDDLVAILDSMDESE